MKNTCTWRLEGAIAAKHVNKKNFNIPRQEGKLVLRLFIALSACFVGRVGRTAGEFKFRHCKKVKQSRYRPGVAQRVPGS